MDKLKSAFIPTSNQRNNETLIDFKQNIENNPHRNYEENDNAVPENQQKIQDNTATEKKKKQKEM